MSLEVESGASTGVEGQVKFFAALSPQPTSAVTTGVLAAVAATVTTRCFHIQSLSAPWVLSTGISSSSSDFLLTKSLPHPGS